MKRLICVELHEEHPAVSYYTIRFSDEKEPLFDQFLTNFSDEKFETDIFTITAWLDKIGNAGALERYFKPEGHPKVKAIPIPPPSSDLRLYCFRVSESILILAGGGEKKTRTYQEDAVLSEQVRITKKVGKKLLRLSESGKISIAHKELSGKLTFEIEL